MSSALTLMISCLLLNAITYGQCTSPKKCPKNERYVDCVNKYNTCVDREYVCSQRSESDCKPGCDCKAGYLRNEQGKCVLEKKCDDCSGKNEKMVDCAKPKWCNTCDIRGNCKVKCSRGCDCKPGFYRNSDGVCIRESKCPDCPGKNEEIVDCAKPEWCNTCDIRGDCKLTSCSSGCDCKPDYYRNSDGVCIPASECPDYCGENEEYNTCGTACQPTCSKPNPACTKQCAEGCFCKRGYIRKEKDGKCIKKESCKKNDSCGRDEQMYECTPFCTNRCNPLKACPKICKKGCFCRTGLVQDDDGKCVKKKDCAKKPPGGEECDKDEQYYQCKPVCNNTCENYNIVGPCPTICGSGCFCKKGLLLRSDGACVKPEKCNATDDSCGRDEQMYDCPPFCTNRCNPLKFCPRFCKKGCFCRAGLVQDDKGKCVKKKDCAKKPPGGEECDKDEQYYQCKPVCNNTCENYKKVGACPTICASGCFCKEGLLLRSDGACVKPKKCNTTGHQCPQVRCTKECPLDETAKPCPKCKCAIKPDTHKASDSDDDENIENEDEYDSGDEEEYVSTYEDEYDSGDEEYVSIYEDDYSEDEEQN